jgi:hypothetical protein
MTMFVTTVTALFTLALYSFLYKDNPVYRLAEHVFAGLSAGYYAGLIFQSVLVQQLWVPLLGGRAWLVIPALLGVLTFARLSPKWSWLSRVALAFVIGSNSGILVMQQLHGLVLPQVSQTFVNMATLQGLLIVVGVVSTLIYFYFSKPHTGLLGGVATVGIWFIMISFGANFGYTVMARVSLLIGRVQFLVLDWPRLVIDWFR